MNFTKVEGCGNHFILLDGIEFSLSNLSLTPQLIRDLCQPNFGIGADGVLLIQNFHDQPHGQSIVYEMIVFNADGHLAQMCGNGLRCVVEYLHHHYDFLPSPKDFGYIQTGAGPLKVMVSSHTENLSQWIGVEMGWPSIQENVTHRQRHFDVLSFGNPHIVTYAPTDYTDRKQLALQWDQLIEGGVNLSFAKQLNEHSIQLYVHERGCGWTLACGTGACASVFIGYKEERFRLGQSIDVHLPGGHLKIEITSRGLVMWGPAKRVFRGQYLI